MSPSPVFAPPRSPEELQALGRGAAALLFPDAALDDPENEGVRTYAVLDGASVPGLIPHLYTDTDRPEFACLYRGELEPDMAEVAPYLVRLAPDHPFTAWLLTEGWGRHWGIFLKTTTAFKEVHRHLRGFLRVKNPEGRTFLFRFYDPRVARLFLPTCNAAELKLLMGPVSRWLLEAEDPAICLEFNLAAGALALRQFHLLPEKPAGAGGPVPTRRG